MKPLPSLLKQRTLRRRFDKWYAHHICECSSDKLRFCSFFTVNALPKALVFTGDLL